MTLCFFNWKQNRKSQRSSRAAVKPHTLAHLFLVFIAQTLTTNIFFSSFSVSKANIRLLRWFLRKALSPFAHDNYISLWWLLLLLSLQSTTAELHLLRSVQLYQYAVMELLADNALTAYYSRRHHKGQQRRNRKWERERRWLPQTSLFTDLMSLSALKITNHLLFLHVKQSDCLPVCSFSNVPCGEASQSHEVNLMTRRDIN